MSGKSDFLFAQPSLWEGVGRLIDMGDFLTAYNTSISEELADEIALAMDWRAVYSDLWFAVNLYSESIGESLNRSICESISTSASERISKSVCEKLQEELLTVGPTR